MEFNVTRFFNVAKRDLIINRNLYIGIIVASFALGFITCWKEWLAGVALFLFVVGFMVFIAMSPFSAYKDKRKRCTTLLLPASTEEKWMLEFIKYYIVFPVVITALFWFGTFIGSLVFYQNASHFLLWDGGIPTAFKENIAKILIYGYCGIAVLYFCNLLFKKYSLIKIIAVFIIYTTISSLLSVWLIGADVVHLASDMQHESDPHAIMEYSYAFGNYTDLMQRYTYVITAVFFTVLSYIRLKKEETL
ncbi:MAG: hypothetical protein LBR17_01470 [Bacteroidales bacterium]|jgi:hypothetical protein|nr:hypothetical protein [Bacteroidales bacterium]